MRDLILVGFMGAGKTTMANWLSDYWQVSQTDLDAAIIQRTGQSIAELFEHVGESGFRDQEHLSLQTELSHPGILATGGGIVERADNRLLLKQTKTPIIFLDVSIQTVVQRLGKDHNRPIFNQLDTDALAALAAKRRPYYCEVADSVIVTDALSVEAIGVQIDRMWQPKDHDQEIF